MPSTRPRQTLRTLSNEETEMTLIGYTRHANPDRLREAGCEDVFDDHGGPGQGAQWYECLDRLERGDTLLVSKVTEISRRLSDMLSIAQDLTDRGVTVRFTDQPDVDLTSPRGRFIFHTLMALASFEADLAAEHGEDDAEYDDDPEVG